MWLFRRMGDRGEMTMKEVFVQCQTGLQGHGKLTKTLLKIYEKTEFDVFWSEFNHYLKYAMIVFKREPAVERMVDFVSKFVTSLSKKVNEKGEGDAPTDDDDEADSVADNRLLQEMFDFLLKSHSARDRGVRFRCCQLINKLLTNLGEDAQIDDELYDRLYECMLERLKDKCPMVRYHAVMAMARLQDPTDENCPVIKAYLFLLNCDPNPDVRRAVLSSIAPSTKTLASIVGRTRDVKDTVRKTAYEVLAEKIHIKALSIALRLQLVSEGLNDRAEMVKLACSGKLLTAWMRTFNGNILALLKSLDVEDSTDICSRVLETLFEASTVSDMIEQFDILNEQLLVPSEALTCESALYWQAVCKYIHAMGTEGDEHMEKVMPSVVDFCAYMHRYVEDLKTVIDPEIQLGREFIIEQLLLITSFMDTADVASKKALETLLHKMLMADHVSHRLVKSIVARICALRGTGDNMIAYFAEMVSEIREPITLVEKDVEAELKRQINLKIAGIRVQLNQFREDLDTAVKEQNFEHAAEIKASIAQLDHEKNKLLETQEPVREEVRTERNDPLTILKCQAIMSEMLQILKLSNVSPTLQMMIETQIVPGIQNEDAEVRNLAMKTLGLCCYLSKDLLVTYIPLFMQASQIDVEGVRVTALQILFDILLIYGLEIVDASEGSSNNTPDHPQGGEGMDSTTVSSDTSSRTSDSRASTASKLVAIICSFLDGESSELRTCAAEGLAKLLLSGRVVSSKILSHLILLWYNPLSEDDTHLRDCLGTFFPLYALASRSNQEVVEEAFVPTLRTLLNAPTTSPLAEVDVNNVAELLVQLTNTKLLTANQNKEEISLDNPGHDNLSETVCNEILSNPESSHVKLWVKILNQMEVSPDNEVLLKDLRILAYKMVKTVKEKLSLKALQKFQSRIMELASKFVTDNDDLANIEINPVASVVNNETMDDTLDTTAQTPKRKRVRGLYSQNMTLALESEEEIDIADDSTVEVDASCLMSRSASVDTPQRRPRKNTATTDVADEVFVAEEAERKEKSEGQKSEVIELAGVEETDESSERGPAKSAAKTSPSKQVPEKIKPKDSEDRKESAEEETVSKSPKSPRGRPVGKKTGSPKKSPQKSPDKRKASKSPVNASPGKRLSSESPAQSKQKRKASKSPSRDKKKMSLSPNRSSPDSQSSSKSPAKRKASRSPIREDGGRRKISKSPIKSAGLRKKSQSPVKETTTRLSLKSPVKGAASKPAKENQNKDLPAKTQSGKLAEIKKAAANKPISTRSPVKSKTNVGRDAAKKVTKETVKPPGKTLAKDDGKVPLKPSSVKDKAVVAKDVSKKQESPEKKRGVVGKPQDNAGKEKGGEKNVRKALPKTVESPVKGRVRATAATPKSPRVAAGKQTPVNSPRKGGKDADTNKELVVSLTRIALKTGTTVEDTPEQVSRRVSTRSAIRATPDVSSPRNTRSGKEMSVAETPDLDTAEKSTKGRKADAKSTGRSTRSVADTPELNSVSRSVRSARRKANEDAQETPAGRTTGRRQAEGTTPSASSASESSPEKSVTKSARSVRSRVLMSSQSTTSSPDTSSTAKSTKAASKASPVKVLVKEASETTTDDEGEISIRRKAKPSRRSANASSSMISTPPTSGRPTRGSVATRSLAGTPVVGQSPKQARSLATGTPAASSPKPGSPATRSTRKSERSSSQESDSGSRVPVRRSTRGTGDESSQDSTISLLSQNSTASSASGKSRGSVSTNASTSARVATNKAAAPRSKSSSEMLKTGKTTASAAAAKGGRSTVSSTKQEAGNRKYHLERAGNKKTDH